MAADRKRVVGMLLMGTREHGGVVMETVSEGRL